MAKQTHESYIAAIRDMVLNRVGKADRTKLQKTRLVYGTGNPGTRGTTCYELWKHDDEQVADVIEICLAGEENPRQIAGTVLHELGHVLAGHAAGHDHEWKSACKKLGLSGAAVGTNYDAPGVFDELILELLKEIPEPTDGRPGVGVVSFKAGKGGCKAGLGTKGGKSRGKGSGSRLKKVGCPKCGYQCRITMKWIDKGLPTCPCGTLMTAENETPVAVNRKVLTVSKFD